mgnify:CR=1 FL=1
MSLSVTIKQEIIKKNVFKLQDKSLLQGFFIACGNLIVSSGGINFTVSSELEDVINFAKEILCKKYPDVDFVYPMHFLY